MNQEISETNGKMRDTLYRITQLRMVISAEYKKTVDFVPVYRLNSEDQKLVKDEFKRLKVIYQLDNRANEQTIILENRQAKNANGADVLIECIVFLHKSAEGNPVITTAYYTITSQDLSNGTTFEDIGKKMVSLYNEKGYHTFMLGGQVEKLDMNQYKKIQQTVNIQKPGYTTQIADITSGPHTGVSLILIVKSE